jgi:hypothetical protein
MLFAYGLTNNRQGSKQEGGQRRLGAEIFGRRERVECHPAYVLTEFEIVSHVECEQPDW